jgi:DNA-binding transcriptional ArsR family regulator
MTVVQTDGSAATAAPAEAGSAAGREDCGCSEVGEAPGLEALQLEAVLHALSDPVRLGIVCSLAAAGSDAELACKAFALPVVKSTATHHFRVLREAGVIRQRVCGTTRLNALRREELQARFPGLLDAVLAAASPAEA